MEKNYVIGLDVGTQSTRVIIFDRNGDIASKGLHRHQPHLINRPGWAEHPMGDLWNAFLSACRQALDNFEGNVEEIAAFGLSTQRCCRAFVNEQGELMHPMMSWLDTRTLKPIEKGAYDDVYRFLTNSGYYCAKLTGEFKDTYANMTGYGDPFSQKERAWISDPADFARFNIPREKLPDLVAPGEILGYITPETAKETGLPAGLPVVAAAGDKQVEALGAGAIDDGQAYITCGTYCGLMLVGSDYLEGPSMGCYAGAQPDKYTYEGFGVRRGFWCVSWFCREFGAAVEKTAAEQGISKEEAFDRLAEKVPMGCEGLMMIPDFVPTSADQRYRRGSFLGFDGRHTLAHLYRAVLEGIALTLKHNIDWMVDDIKREIKEIRIGGGGSNSTIGMQIFADVFGVPVIRTTISESCSLGAAIDAAVGCGMYSDFVSAADHMVHIRDRFEPYAENHKFYSQLLEEVYSKVRPITDLTYQDAQKFWDEWDEKF